MLRPKGFLSLRLSSIDISASSQERHEDGILDSSIKGQDRPPYENSYRFRRTEKNIVQRSEIVFSESLLKYVCVIK